MYCSVYSPICGARSQCTLQSKASNVEHDHLVLYEYTLSYTLSCCVLITMYVLYVQSTALNVEHDHNTYTLQSTASNVEHDHNILYSLQNQKWSMITTYSKVYSTTSNVEHDHDTYTLQSTALSSHVGLSL